MDLVVANQTLVVTSFGSSFASVWRLDPVTSACSCRRRRSTSSSRLRSQDPTKGEPKASAGELGWAAARQQLHQELLRLRRWGPRSTRGG